MTSTLMRTVAVLAVWGAAFVAALLAGAQPRPAELAAVVGAGVTLVVWGVAQGRRPTREAPTGSAEAATRPSEHERDAG